MSDICFVKLLNDQGIIYSSYLEEFWFLVEVNGFKTCLIEEIDYDSDTTYICYLRKIFSIGVYHKNLR